MGGTPPSAYLLNPPHPTPKTTPQLPAWFPYVRDPPQPPVSQQAKTPPSEPLSAPPEPMRSGTLTTLPAKTPLTP